ncbi:MAG TPA: BsuPI-related putative proteinase inhibitor [Longimicrobiaceae bacterium]|nr:BsuPI-related putative proteinase inhibitor [Longimicrobiaceae bacterium]
MRRTLLLTWIVLGACAPRAATRPAPEASAPLLASVQASTLGDTVRFVLQVTDTARAPVDLVFPTSQSYDFVVKQDGRELWRSSAGRAFTQAVRRERWGAGETKSYTAAWAPAPGVRGRVVVEGILTARPRVAQALQFDLE